MTRPLVLATNNGDIAGGEVMLLRLATMARDLGADVTLVAPSAPGDVAAAARASGFRTIEIGAANRRDYLLGLRRWDATGREGLLWCNGLVPAFATTGRRDRVVHLHQQPTGAPHSALLRVARVGVSTVLVPSHLLAGRLGATAFPNWTDPVDVARRPAPSGARRLGFLGRLSPGKGLVTLAEAVRLLDERRPGAYRLLVAGDARGVAAQDRAEVAAALAPISHLIEAPGWIDRSAFYAQVDLAVFPSLFPETFGLVVAEAMAARVPFVISDAGALPEVAGPGYPWVATAGDARALATTIHQALDSNEAGIQDAAYARWEAEYSPAAGRRRLAATLTGLGVLAGSAR